MSEQVAPQEAAQKKKIIFSGIQPTGVMTLGNYLGAVKNWVKLQEDYDCIYSVVNMHAITVRQDPKALRENTLRAFALLLACGLDPEKCLMFIQSHVKTHAELSWVLGCHTQFGELSRMTQFKDKSQRNADNINAGLFTYPVLMAADILLYQADMVPVGADQKQHLELSRDIAMRFNNLYGNTFRVPEPYIPENGARIMSLAEPQKKMSKSDDNQNAFIAILDSEDTIIKKFKRAVTDSDMEVAYREGKDGINNLMTIYSAVTGKSYPEIEREFQGKGYGDFKVAVGQAVADHLRPVRENFERFYADKAYLKEVYTAGAERALRLSGRTLEKVYKKVGFLPA
ncbi:MULTISPECIES: tryptophan--tRNA ligase [Oscillospiraceae]|uniref:Tryptophan--tRNA ligase n=1 Tax=Harryflintia acetispora TaxID=1849041 RepID=A0A9X8Y8J4_9FIRM|nr:MULTISPECIES: tryptophan--tRNA ligase [Oscillospiraceae]RGB63787.1 tryptophan--tRNA ligase [Harryflintia acetispora]TCL43681.1 tryptophanyl-tRNA synthetase [Harryflintia acetispora]